MFMRLNETLCQNWKLYVITDAEAAGKRPLLEVVRQALEGGADVVQLRDKILSDSEMTALARLILQLTRPRNIPLIINDRVLVSKASGADGVHLGQLDASLEEARAHLGPDALVGRSTHSPTQALEAQAQGFDYIGIGPVFRTPTKPSYEPVGLELVRFAKENIHIPFVAIGGIDQTNAHRVVEAGASAVAVVRAVMGSPDPRLSAIKIKEALLGRP